MKDLPCLFKFSDCDSKERENKNKILKSKPDHNFFKLWVYSRLCKF